jgi:hypothetical protein
MLFLHVSDIHFKAPECLDSDTDPDFSIRTRMVRDLTSRVAELGNVDGILVGGDVAFKADPDEYTVAWLWLQKLAEISGCPPGRIFVVPGNHDVDRKVIEKSVPTQNVQHAIYSAPGEQRESTLRRQLRDKDSGQHLLLAHTAYNNFAAPMGCQIWPSKVFWHQDVPLNDDVRLRIYGLTSTLLSGRNGTDEKERELYLSPLQTVLDPASDVVNLVMIHHPPDWLADQDAVDDRLTGRAMFHLFGHKHRQRAMLEASYVRLGAGAVNPSRHEKPYDPGYNLIRIELQGAGIERRVKVEVHQRKLQENPERFVAILTAQGEDVFRTSIAFPDDISATQCRKPELAVAASAPLPEQHTVVVASIVTINEESTSTIIEEDAEAAMGNEDTRDLLYRFWKLSTSQRRKIALDLNLIDRTEISLPEPERYGKAFIRAGERKQLGDVANEIAKLEER